MVSNVVMTATILPKATIQSDNDNDDDKSNGDDVCKDDFRTTILMIMTAMTIW